MADPGSRVACIATLAVLCLSFAACGGSLGHRSVAVLEGSLPIPAGVTEVVVEVQNGSVRVLSHDLPTLVYQGGVRRAGDTAEQLRQLEAVPVVLSAVPDPAAPTTLRVRAPAIPAATDQAGEPLAQHAVLGVDVTIHLPAALRVAVRVTGSGHLVAENRRADLELATGRGDLRVSGCSGAVQARTGRGTVIVYDHVGNLDVEALAGEMQVFVRQPGEQLVLRTGEGNVQCYIPVDCGFRVDARTQTGKLANGFGLAMERVEKYGAVMRGTQGDGRTAIVLRTGKGHLSLTHKKFD